MKKEPFKYVCIALFVYVAGYWGYKYFFPTTYVYVEDGSKIYHSTPVCENILGMQVLDEVNEVLGSQKVDEKEVFYDENYIMCNYCFSPMQIESRTKYIYRSLK
jgi:hypothetical protein